MFKLLDESERRPRVSIWADDETESILPAILVSGLKVRSNG